MQNPTWYHYNLSTKTHPDGAFKAKPHVIRRARAYMEAMDDPSIAGQDGHNSCFRVACSLVRIFGFDLSDTLRLLIEYNHECDPPWSFQELLHKAEDALRLAQPDAAASELRRAKESKPHLADFRKFCASDISKLSRARNIPEKGVRLAVERGFLQSGIWHDMDCYALSDKSGKLIELRRKDGELFPAVAQYNLGARKSHTIRGSQKSWPIGILESEPYACVALVEGGPDFVYAHYKIVQEEAQDRVAIVAMMSAAPAIAQDALPMVQGKKIRIFPHLDQAGLQAARKWQSQLVSAGATTVDLFDLADLTTDEGDPVEDLCDLTKCKPESITNLGRILP